MKKELWEIVRKLGESYDIVINTFYDIVHDTLISTHIQTVLKNVF